MGQNTNLIKHGVFSTENGPAFGNSCIYSRIDSITYEIELIPLKTRSLSPTINIAYWANLDFKVGWQRLIAPSSGLGAVAGSWRFQIQCYRFLLIMFQVRYDISMEFSTWNEWI